MKLREYLRGLEKPPGFEPEPPPDELAEAAMELLDVTTPAIDALGGVRKHCLDVGLSEAHADEIVMGIVRKMVEGM